MKVFLILKENLKNATVNAGLNVLCKKLLCSGEILTKSETKSIGKVVRSLEEK